MMEMAEDLKNALLRTQIATMSMCDLAIMRFSKDTSEDMRTAIDEEFKDRGCTPTRLIIRPR